MTNLAIGHWVNKDASAWAKSYFDENLTKISAEDNGVSAKIDSVLEVGGDVDVSQRKGKVITLFDVKIRLEYNGTLWCLLQDFLDVAKCRFVCKKNVMFMMCFVSTGKTADDKTVSGTITIPEVAHDTEEDEYVVCDPPPPTHLPHCTIPHQPPSNNSG